MGPTVRVDTEDVGHFFNGRRPVNRTLYITSIYDISRNLSLYQCVLDGPIKERGKKRSFKRKPVVRYEQERERERERVLHLSSPKADAGAARTCPGRFPLNISNKRLPLLRTGATHAHHNIGQQTHAFVSAREASQRSLCDHCSSTTQCSSTSQTPGGSQNGTS